MTYVAGSGLRLIYYRKHFRRMGDTCIIGPYVVIDHPERVSLGLFVMIDSLTRIEAGRGVHIGDCCHICSGCVLSGAGSLYIGNNVAVSAGTKV